LFFTKQLAVVCIFPFLLLFSFLILSAYEIYEFLKDLFAHRPLEKENETASSS
jgi:hypothetical protein